jgi:cytochrome d ubiquinol oxidase subunit II
VAATAWMVVILLCLTLYVVLDGYDLGVGVLVLFDHDDARRKTAVEGIATAWDGNESWLILLGVALYGGFPAAYAVALPAVYLPLVVMLFGLILRGAAIEMVSAAPGYRRGWGLVFGLASVVAAFAQGVAFGGLCSGVQQVDGRFTGGTFDFLGGFSVAAGLVTVALYTLAGACWLYYRGTGELRRRAGGAGRAAVLVTAAGVAGLGLTVPLADPGFVGLSGVGRAWVFWPALVIAAAALVIAYEGLRHEHDARPFLAVVVAEVSGLVAFTVLIWPVVVPPDLTIDAAAAPRNTLDFLLIGVGLCLPVIFTYNGYAYWVFRGKSGPGGRPVGLSTTAAAVRPGMTP